MRVTRGRRAGTMFGLSPCSRPLQLERAMTDNFIWCLFALILACLAGGMVLYDQEREDELLGDSATFQGRPVQAWLDDLRSEEPSTFQEAMQVLDMIGPANA